jgi:uncharacterized caspase-like protein
MARRNAPGTRWAASDGSAWGVVALRTAPAGLVAFATEPGNVAADQSLYSRALAEELVKPGLEATQVFRRVRARVRAETRQAQSPEHLDKRDYDFNFAQR